MKLEFFIAKRILVGGNHKSGFTKPVINIAVWGIALGVLIMVMAVAITKGFQKEIKSKIVGFASDIQISDVGISESYESNPIPFDTSLYLRMQEDPLIKHVQQYASKAGIIKTDDDMLGVILKGITNDFNWDFFRQHLVEGEILRFEKDQIGKETMISSKIAKTLGLKLGDQFRVFFITQQVRNGREEYKQKKYAFSIKGIYETGLSEEFDSKFIFVDLKRIQKLNQWETTTIGGYEVFLASNEENNLLLTNSEGSYAHYIKQEDQITDTFFDALSFLDVRSIYTRYPQIISWLDYIDMHISIILVIILVVAIVNMSSSLLILILEKTNMIGILKSLGATNLSIRKIFLMKATFLIGKGVLYGNILALIVCVIQWYFQPLQLDPAVYYIDAVPVYLNIYYLLIINILTVFVCAFMLIIPSIFISYISPVKAIRWE